MFWCESEKVKAALTCMHVISEVTPWLWESQFGSHHPCVPGCVCQRDIPCWIQGLLECASWPLVTRFYDGFHRLVWVMSEASQVGSFSFFLVSVQFVQFQERLVHSFPSATHTPFCSACTPSCHGLDSWCPVGRLAIWARLQLHQFSVCSPARDTGGGQTDRRHIALDWSGCWQRPLRLGGHICKGGHGRHSHDRATRWQRALRALRALPGSYGSSSGSIRLLLKRKALRRQKIPSLNSYNDPVMVYITDGKRRLEDTKYVIWGHTTVQGWQLITACREPNPAPDTGNPTGSIFCSCWKNLPTPVSDTWVEAPHLSVAHTNRSSFFQRKANFMLPWRTKRMLSKP